MSQPASSCKFNGMIECSGAAARPCGKCGWNPEVIERRLKKIREPKQKKQVMVICRA